jgi:ribosomal protein S18 acetylase RimI-like enzyme
MDATGESVVYREATIDDLPAIARMYDALDADLRRFGERGPLVSNVGQAYVDSFRTTLGRFSALFVATNDGGVVAFQGARIKRLPPFQGGVLVGEMAGKWTEPAARRLGLGRTVTRLALEWLRDRGVHSVELQVPEGNEASWALFKAFGFRPETRRYRLTWDDFGSGER